MVRTPITTFYNLILVFVDNWEILLISYLQNRRLIETCGYWSVTQP